MTTGPHLVPLLVVYLHIVYENQVLVFGVLVRTHLEGQRSEKAGEAERGS